MSKLPLCSFNIKAIRLRWEPEPKQPGQVWTSAYEDKMLLVRRDESSKRTETGVIEFIPWAFAGFIALKKIGVWGTPMAAMENVGRVVRGLPALNDAKHEVVM